MACTRVITHVSLAILTLTAVCVNPAAHATGTQQSLSGPPCGNAGPAPAPSVEMGRIYAGVAYRVLLRDRARYAGLGAQIESATLAGIAENHSVYMASIGNWSDGDPAGSILQRVRTSGLSATYAGQNVVTASGPSVPEAIQQGEAFFAGEAAGGGPHWDNITNPNHRYTGIGVAVLGSAGNYTIYLTQVFSDAGGCAQSAPPATTNPSPPASNPAAASAISLHPGMIVRPTVDILQLRTEPRGAVIAALHPRDHLQVIAVQQGWAQVKILSSGMFGWAYAPFLAPA